MGVFYKDHNLDAPIDIATPTDLADYHNLTVMIIMVILSHLCR